MKACYEKALSLEPQDAMTWYNLGRAGGGPEGAAVRGASGGHTVEVFRGLFLQRGVRGEVKKWFFCEGIVESVEGACRFLLACCLNFCSAGLFGAESLVPIWTSQKSPRPAA